MNVNTFLNHRDKNSPAFGRMISSAFTLLMLMFCLSSSTISNAQETIDGWLVFNTSNSSLPNNHVRDIAFDRKGLLWIGTWGGGLARFNQYDGSWMLYNQTNSGIPGSQINQIAVARDGKIWMVAADGGFASFDGDNWNAVPMPDGVQPISIAVNKGGVVLIGTQQHGLYMYGKDKVLARIWGEDNNFLYNVPDIDFDNDDNALVCTKQGLFRFSNAGGRYTSVKKVISNFPAYKVAYEKEKEIIWVIEGEDQKVAKYKRKRWRTYDYSTPDIYLSINDEAPTYRASEIVPVSSKMYSIAIGTHYFGGIAVYGGKFWGAIFTPYSGSRMTGGIETMAQDRNDALWVGTWNKGLMVKVGEDLEDMVGEEVVELSDEETLLPDDERKKIIEKKKTQKRMVRSRKVEVIDTVYSGSREVVLLIWDAQKVDGDSISLMLNGEFILENHLLTKTPKRIRATLKSKDNRLVLYAHNLGTIPPNTATISILDTGNQKEVTLMADEQNSQAVIVIQDDLVSESAIE